MKKITITAVLIIAVSIVGVISYVLNNLDDLVKAAIEKYGSEATQTSVMVSSVKIDLQDGAAAIKGLTISNPSGFQAPLAFSLGEIGSKINLASLSEDIIVIDDIRVRAPQVFAEINKDKKINLNQLKDNILKIVPKGGATKKEEPTQNSEPRLIINRILFEEGFIDARIVPLDNKEFKLTLPSFELKNLGGKSGATPAEIAQQVLKKLTDIALSEVKKKGIDQKLDKLKEKARAEIEAKKNKLKAESQTKMNVKKDEANKKLDAKKEEAKDKLKNLFGR
jgi:hypothetical protein